MQTTEEFLQAYARIGVKTPRSMYAQLTYDSVWTVALTLQQTMERLAKNNNTHLEDFTYKSGSATFDELFDMMGQLEFMGVSVSEEQHYHLHNTCMYAADALMLQCKQLNM